MLEVAPMSNPADPDAPIVVCDPVPPRRFLFSLPTLGGGAKLPIGGIFVSSGFGVWTCVFCMPAT